MTHVDELQYQFRSSFFVSHELSPKDKQISDIILTLWTNFAKNKYVRSSLNLLFSPFFSFLVVVVVVVDF